MKSTERSPFLVPPRSSTTNVWVRWVNVRSGWLPPLCPQRLTIRAPLPPPRLAPRGPPLAQRTRLPCLLR
ncbi:hypothetical protein GN956_G1912 [Arapaima gigas]